MGPDSESHSASLLGDMFGLRSAADIEQLGRRTVSAEVWLYPDSVESLYPLAPAERRLALAQWREDTVARISAAIPLHNVRLTPRQEPYLPFACELTAEALLALLRYAGGGSVNITGVEGMKPKPKPRRRRKRLQWFAVQARFAIQLEDQASGFQPYEDRIVLVKAYGEDDAKERLRNEFADYGSPYLNNDCVLVRFQFESILDVAQPVFEKIDPAGTEVCFAWGKRKMTPKREWYPQREWAMEREYS